MNHAGKHKYLYLQASCSEFVCPQRPLLETFRRNAQMYAGDFYLEVFIADRYGDSGVSFKDFSKCIGPFYEFQYPQSMKRSFEDVSTPAAVLWDIANFGEHYWSWESVSEHRRKVHTYLFPRVELSGISPRTDILDFFPKRSSLRKEIESLPDLEAFRRGERFVSSPYLQKQSTVGLKEDAAKKGEFQKFVRKGLLSFEDLLAEYGTYGEAALPGGNDTITRICAYVCDGNEGHARFSTKTRHYDIIFYTS